MITKPLIQATALFAYTANQPSSTQLFTGRNDVDSNRRLAINMFGHASVISYFGVSGASGLSPEEASVAYDSYAANYDDLDGGKASSALGLDDARAELFRKAELKVLEIGVGTGLNLAKYDKSRVSSLTVVDISEGMIEEARARTKALNLGFPVEFIKADATSELTKIFGADAFDTVVDSFSLCVMGNQGARDCLSQMTNVVKKSGRILLLENSRSSSAVLGWYQDATANAAASVGGKGCVYNQDVASMIRETNGLTIGNEKEFVAGVFRSFECIKNSY
jgi:ubiquinone/menaquinone biosynthesis C-methylase UbiE